jgi:NTP pyrophosphatase (non-canonical NTP hydrolase)
MVEPLIILAEECAEVVQAVSKLQRFGIDDAKNIKALENEIGDVLAMLAILDHYDYLDSDKIMERVPIKLRKLKKYSNIKGLDSIIENL